MRLPDLPEGYRWKIYNPYFSQVGFKYVCLEKHGRWFWHEALRGENYDTLGASQSQYEQAMVLEAQELYRRYFEASR